MYLHPDQFLTIHAWRLAELQAIADRRRLVAASQTARRPRHRWLRMIAASHVWQGPISHDVAEGNSVVIPR